MARSLTAVTPIARIGRQKLSKALPLLPPRAGLTRTSSRAAPLCFVTRSFQRPPSPRLRRLISPPVRLVPTIRGPLDTALHHRMAKQRKSEKPPNHSGKAVRSKWEAKNDRVPDGPPPAAGRLRFRWSP